MKIFAGAIGFTGNAIVEALLADGHDVIAIGRKLPSQRNTVDVFDSGIDVAASVNFYTSCNGVSKIIADNILATQILSKFAAKANKYTLGVK